MVVVNIQYSLFFIPRFALKPLFPLEERDSRCGDKYHEHAVDPEGMWVAAEGDGGVHREHVGIHRHRQEHCGEDREHFHRDIELVRQEGVVGRFERLDRLFVAFEDIPDADIGADKILEIHLEVFGDIRMILGEERFDNRALRLERAAEIEDITLEDRDFEHHLFLLLGEDLGFDEVELLGDMVELGKTGVEEDFERCVEQMRRTLAHVEPATALILGELREEFGELIDIVPMARDEMVLGQDDIELARERRPVIGIEERDMDRQEKTALILDDFGLIGRGHELLDSEGMDIEVLLEIGDVLITRIFEIDPGHLLESDLMHVDFEFCLAL